MSAAAEKRRYACETNHKYIAVSLTLNFISDKVNRYMKIFTR